MTTPPFTLVVGDAVSSVTGLVRESVDVTVTSPPYLAQRHYSADTQIGEHGVTGYLDYVQELGSALWTATKHTGVLWWNIGDTYNAYNHNRGTGTSFSSRKASVHAVQPKGLVDPSKRNKSLLSLPHRTVERLEAAGWILRNTIIWCKPNSAPQRVRDRYRSTYEYVFMLVKDERRYFFNMEAVRDTSVPPDVWTFPVERSPAGHPATFPVELPQRCLAATLPIGGVVLDPFSGSGTTGVAAIRAGGSYIGVDASTDYTDIATLRLQKEVRR